EKLTEQRRQFERIAKELEEHARQNAVEEERQEKRNADYRKEISDLTSRLIEYRNTSSACVEEIEQKQGEQRHQLAELQEFASAQQDQTLEEQRQFGELQRQLIEFNYRLVDYQAEMGRRFERTADRQQHEQLSQEIRAFIAAQEAQTLEEGRQLAEQQKQLSELN